MVLHANKYRGVYNSDNNKPDEIINKLEKMLERSWSIKMFFKIIVNYVSLLFFLCYNDDG